MGADDVKESLAEGAQPLHDQMVKILINDRLSLSDRNVDYLAGIFRNGWVGFDKMGEEELLREVFEVLEMSGHFTSEELGEMAANNNEGLKKWIMERQ